MIDSLVVMLVVVAAISAGLIAGVYFAFSGFIMRSLEQLGGAEAADAMNVINRVILRSCFMPLFFGSTLVHAVLMALAVFDAELPGRWTLFAAGSIYVVGMFVCTAAFNVPLNNQLAGAGSDDQTKAVIWAHYYKVWTRWNHVRGVCSLLALVFCITYLLRYA